MEIPKYTSPRKSRKEKKKQKEYQAVDFSSATECEVAEDRLKENLNAKKKKHLQEEQIISQDLECVHDSSTNGNIFKKSVKKKNQKEFLSEVEKTFKSEAVETDKMEIPKYTSPRKSRKEKKKQKEYQAEDFSSATECEVAEDRLKENLNAKKKKHLQEEQIISQDLECVHDSSTNGNIFKKSVKKKIKKEFISEAERTFGCEAVETDKTEIPEYTSPRKSRKEKKKQKEYQAVDFSSATECEVAEDRLKENLNAKKKKHLQGEQIISQDLECVHDSSTNGNIFKKSVKRKNQKEFLSEVEKTFKSEAVETDKMEIPKYTSPRKSRKEKKKQKEYQAEDFSSATECEKKIKKEFISEAERTFGCEAVETDKTEIPEYTSPRKSRKEKKKQKEYQAVDFSSATECEVTEDRLKENLNAKKKKNLQGEQIVSQDLECVHDSSTNGNIFKKSVKKKNQKEFLSEVEKTFKSKAVETDKMKIPKYLPSESLVKRKRSKRNIKQLISQVQQNDLECVYDSFTNGNISKNCVLEKNGEEFYSKAEKTSKCEVVETDNLENPGYIPNKKSHKHKRKREEYLSMDFLAVPEYEVTEKELKENLSTKKKNLLEKKIISQDLECVHNSSTNGKNSKKSVAEKNGEEFSSKAGTTSLSKVVEIDNLENSNYDLFSESISLNFEPAPVNFSVPLLHKHEKLSVTAEMKESLREKGVVIKYGRFSKEENTILKKNYQQFVEEFGIDDPCLLFGIGSTTRNSKVFRFLRAKHFYIRLGKGLGNRPLISIYKRARTLFNPLSSSKMFEKEEIVKLKHSYNILGNKWIKIGNILGRSDMNCQVSYRWHAKEVNKGKWSSEEENNLINAIKTVAETDDISSNNIKAFHGRLLNDLFLQGMLFSADCIGVNI
ncbi:transcription termination factor 1 [Trichonephila clavipes]|nr:transcription termination factor 1 [Trichonephila clavipes]